jgi:hypothetical protein
MSAGMRRGRRRLPQCVNSRNKSMHAVVFCSSALLVSSRHLCARLPSDYCEFYMRCRMNGVRAAVTESKPAAKPPGVSQAKRLAEKMRSTKAEAIASVTSNKPAGAKAAKKLRTSAPSTPATPNEGGNRSRGPSTPSETVSDVICNCSKICIEGTRGVMTCGKCKRLLHAKCVNISPGLAWLPYTCRACKDLRKRK